MRGSEADDPVDLDTLVVGGATIERALATYGRALLLDGPPRARLQGRRLSHVRGS